MQQVHFFKVALMFFVAFYGINYTIELSMARPKWALLCLNCVLRGEHKYYAYSK